MKVLIFSLVFGFQLQSGSFQRERNLAGCVEGLNEVERELGTSLSALSANLHNGKPIEVDLVNLYHKSWTYYAYYRVCGTLIE